MPSQEDMIKPVRLNTWQQALKQLEQFPLPKLDVDPEGGLLESAWIFRGVEDAAFRLEPSIERVVKNSSLGWAALEAKALEEFRYRAHVHLTSPVATDSEFTWLALMQHHGVPTRLLDFTLSPFVALYFASRPSDRSRDYARVWAIDSQVVSAQSDIKVSRARLAARKREKQKHERRLSFRTEDFASDRDVVKSEARAMHQRVEEVIAASGTLRSELNKQGCVCVAHPPSFNPRLSNQQGLFLLNGAEQLSFTASLKKMMGGQKGWCRAFDIPVSILPEIQRRLFQMNIHEQSMFPDLDGLAGLIKQRITLHWT